MAKRRSKPTELPLVVITWEDAVVHLSEKLQSDLMLQVTTGFLVFEDEKVVVLVHSFIPSEDWFFGLDDNVDYHKIPVSLIKSRAEIGLYQVPSPE